MHRYNKGARSERELIKILSEYGFSVVRAAGSGLKNSPDVIAIKDGVGYCFECKNWKEKSIKIPFDKYQELKDWERNTKFKTFIAWKVQYKGWILIPFENLKENEKSYSISIKEAYEKGIKLCDLLTCRGSSAGEHPAEDRSVVSSNLTRGI